MASNVALSEFSTVIYFAASKTTKRKSAIYSIFVLRCPKRWKGKRRKRKQRTCVIRGVSCAGWQLIHLRMRAQRGAVFTLRGAKSGKYCNALSVKKVPPRVEFPITQSYIRAMLSVTRLHFPDFVKLFTYTQKLVTTRLLAFTQTSDIVR